MADAATTLDALVKDFQALKDNASKFKFLQANPALRAIYRDIHFAAEVVAAVTEPTTKTK